MQNKQKNETKNYSHLTLSDRIKIEQGLNEGLSLRKIAIRINKNPSTVGREILQRRCPKLDAALLKHYQNVKIIQNAPYADYVRISAVQNIYAVHAQNVKKFVLIIFPVLVKQ